MGLRSKVESQVRNKVYQGTTSSGSDVDIELFLQKYANLLAIPRIEVSYAPIPTAACKEQDDGSYSILINQDPADEKLPEMTERRTQAVMHEGMLYHEIGHVLYTDQNVFEEVQKSVTLMHRGAFKKFWNAIEDGVIEVYLREEYDCGALLDAKNKLHLKKSRLNGTMSPNSANKVQAAQYVALMYGKFGQNEIPEIEGFDEVVKKVKQEMNEIVRETDPSRRYRMIRDLFQEISYESESVNTRDLPQNVKENENSNFGEAQTITMPSLDDEDDEDDGDEEEKESEAGSDNQSTDPEYTDRVEQMLNRYETDEMEVQL